MKKVKSKELRKVYIRENLGTGVRGKYYQSYKKGTNLVLLNPDVAKAFPTDKAVNTALKSLMEIAKKTVHVPKIRD
jgi:hypothetical protein